MESGGTRMGSRSSTRYGPATVFSGPVRRWKKRWIPIPPSSSSASAAAASASAPSPKLCLYKWTSINGGGKDDADDPSAPPPRKIRYVPVSVIEEQRKEAESKADEESQPSEAAMPPSEDTSKVDVSMEPVVEPTTADPEADKSNA